MTRSSTKRAATTSRQPLTPTPAQLDARLIARLDRLSAFLLSVGDPYHLAGLTPFTEATAATVREQAPRIAELQRNQIIGTVSEFVPKPQRAAVLSRDVLTARWPVSAEVKAAIPGLEEALAPWAAFGRLAPGDLVPGTFPADVALLPASEWAHKRATPGRFKAWLGFVVQSLRGGIGQDSRPRRRRLHGYGWVTTENIDPRTILAAISGITVETDDTFGTPAHDMWDEWTMAVLIYQAVDGVERDRGRGFFAVDASAPHVALWEGIAATIQPSLTESLSVRQRENRVTGVGKVELLAPGRIVQLSLDLDTGSVRENVQRLIYEVVGPRAARHHVALEARLTTDGHRTGSVAWDVDAHLDTMGIRPEEFRHHRAEAIAAVKALAKLEVAIYDQNHQIRVRQPIVAVTAELDVQSDEGWQVRELILKYAPALYEGVRQLNGRPGRNWYPSPLALPTVNENRFPYAQSFGIILATRFRRAVDEKKDYVRLSGINALKAAGIKLSAKHPERAWTSLSQTLAVLVEIGSIKSWRWTSGPDTVQGVLEILAPDWSSDRALRGIRFKEPTAGEVPANGAELLAWRTRHRLTIEQAAARVGVSSRTILRAEQQPTKGLTNRLRARLRRFP